MNPHHWTIRQEAINEIITAYWLRYYCGATCTLCGNHGVIDGRDIRSPAGVRVGCINWCICPNGQAYREAYVGYDPEEEVAGMEAALERNKPKEVEDE